MNKSQNSTAPIIKTYKQTLFNSQNFSLQQYFNSKKLNIIAFFKKFHEVIQSTSIQTQLEIDKQYKKAKTISQIVNQNIVIQECLKMMERQKNVFEKMIDIVCCKLKQNLNSKTYHWQDNVEKIQSKLQYIKIHSPQQKNNQYKTPQRKQNNENQFKQIRHIPLKGRSGSLQNIRAQRPSILISPQKQAQLINSTKKNQSICENLDRKIHEEALGLLKKQKQNRSASKNRKPQYNSVSSPTRPEIRKFNIPIEQSYHKNQHQTHPNSYSAFRRQTILSSGNIINQRNYPVNNSNIQKHIDAKIHKEITKVNREPPRNIK